MNPIIERLGEQPKQWLHKGEQLVHPLVERVQEQSEKLVERVHEQSEKLRQKGTEFLSDLQQRQEKLFDRGQQALTTFELNALERVEEVLGWAHGITGEKSDVLKRGREFVGDRLEELRKAEDEGDGEAPATAKAEAKDAKATAQDEVVEARLGHTEKPVPFEGYDELGAKKLMQKLEELDRDTLLRAKEYEAGTRARKSVLDAIERRLA